MTKKGGMDQFSSDLPTSDSACTLHFFTQLWWTRWSHAEDLIKLFMTSQQIYTDEIVVDQASNEGLILEIYIKLDQKTFQNQLYLLEDRLSGVFDSNVQIQASTYIQSNTHSLTVSRSIENLTNPHKFAKHFTSAAGGQYN